MSLITVEGTYREGRVELDEAPAEAAPEARVLVTFLPSCDTAPLTGGTVEEARTRVLARMRRGIDFGGGTFKREEVYEERLRELGR